MWTYLASIRFLRAPMKSIKSIKPVHLLLVLAITLGQRGLLAQVQPPSVPGLSSMPTLPPAGAPLGTASQAPSIPRSVESPARVAAAGERGKEPALAGKEPTLAGKEPAAPGKEPAVPEPADQEDEQTLKAQASYQGPFLLASDLFAGAANFRQTPLVSVSDDYLLGGGDEMVLYIFGNATLEVPLVVDRTGSVTIPKIGVARVAGLRLGDARRVVQKLVNTLYSGSRVDLQFSKTRDVRIFILGEVFRPGSYLVPSLTSLLNALAASHGPTPYGSYRGIQLLRAGKIIQTLDLYELRLKGQGMEGVLLRDGDTLFVPVAGVQVLMDGAFARVAASPASKEHPGVLVELKPGETAWNALQLIGGLLPSAYQGLVTLQRMDPNGVISVENLPLDPAFLRAKQLYPEDKLLALTHAEWTGGLVRVTGRVKVPGSFAQRPGMRVADLLRQPDQLLPDTYLERGQIIRTHDDGSTEMLVFNVAQALRGDSGQNLELKPRDQVTLFKVEDLRLKYTVRVIGPFTRSGSFDWHAGMRAADLVFAAGIPKLNADRYYAELAHLDPKGQPGEVAKLDLSRLLYTVDGPAPGLQDPAVNPLLRPFDQITLYEIPNFKVHHTVTISGQVARPGPYVLTENHFTLRQLIERAGGLSPEAMPKGGIFLRKALREKDLNESDLKKAGVEEKDPTGQGINEILQRLSETKRSKDGGLLSSPVLHDLLDGTANRLIVDFEAALRGDPRRDVELLDGDQIIIPRQAQSAYVVGEVASPFATFRAQPGDKVRDLIRMAGGFTRNADRGEVRLLKADGRITDTWTMGREVEPGDAVLVPQRFRTNTTWQETLLALTPLALIYNAVSR